MPAVTNKLPSTLIVEPSIKTDPLPPPPPYELSAGHVSNVTISITTKPSKEQLLKLNKLEAHDEVQAQADTEKPHSMAPLHSDNWKLQEKSANVNLLNSEALKRKLPLQQQQQQQLQQQQLQQQQQQIEEIA
ncbi:uncharacterized protein Dvir_GJ25929 [Drosophila virilis]|uniref:Uncharacterized protein n=1 Tax=Drosophila virilis TaxID=7244 RepID=A0A0Q9WKI7_DROVI|nr:uncharacterized protein Dvir_GJ25929 [Drosophila virilis]